MSEPKIGLDWTYSTEATPPNADLHVLLTGSTGFPVQARASRSADGQVVLNVYGFGLVPFNADRVVAWCLVNAPVVPPHMRLEVGRDPRSEAWVLTDARLPKPGKHVFVMYLQGAHGVPPDVGYVLGEVYTREQTLMFAPVQRTENGPVRFDAAHIVCWSEATPRPLPHEFVGLLNVAHNVSISAQSEPASPPQELSESARTPFTPVSEACCDLRWINSLIAVARVLGFTAEVEKWEQGNTHALDIETILCERIRKRMHASSNVQSGVGIVPKEYVTPAEKHRYWHSLKDRPVPEPVTSDGTIYVLLRTSAQRYAAKVTANGDGTYAFQIQIPGARWMPFNYGEVVAWSVYKHHTIPYDLIEEAHQPFKPEYPTCGGRWFSIEERPHLPLEVFVRGGVFVLQRGYQRVEYVHLFAGPDETFMYRNQRTHRPMPFDSKSIVAWCSIVPERPSEALLAEAMRTLTCPSVAEEEKSDAEWRSADPLQRPVFPEGGLHAVWILRRGANPPIPVQVFVRAEFKVLHHGTPGLYFQVPTGWLPFTPEHVVCWCLAYVNEPPQQFIDEAFLRDFEPTAQEQDTAAKAPEPTTLRWHGMLGSDVPVDAAVLGRTLTEPLPLYVLIRGHVVARQVALLPATGEEQQRFFRSAGTSTPIPFTPEHVICWSYLPDQQPPQHFLDEAQNPWQP